MGLDSLGMNTEGVRRVAVSAAHDTGSRSSCSLLGITKNAGRELRGWAVADARCCGSGACRSRGLRNGHGAWTLAHEALLLIVKSLHANGLLLLSLLLADEEVGKTSKNTDCTDNHQSDAGLCAGAQTRRSRICHRR